MNIAIVGATGMVGVEMLEVLAKSSIEINQLYPVASSKSLGKFVNFKGNQYKVITIEEVLTKDIDIALFSAGGDISLKWAPKFAKKNIVVIDNSSAWRMSPNHQLIIPEINASVLSSDDKIIANPNCSTIQMLVAIADLHKKYKVKRIVVSTYQSISGTGIKAVNQLEQERNGSENIEMIYPYQIDKNCLPHCDDFTENGYTKEEMKLMNETKKILDNNIEVSATAVRVPVEGGHSESINVEFEKPFELNDVFEILRNTNGVVLQDDVKNNIYPMPITSYKKDEVFVGRVRRDFSRDNTLNLWVVADNLRKGAATNTVQIAKYLIDKKLI